jgi:putative CocE/NonD family hydrolase
MTLFYPNAQDAPYDQRRLDGRRDVLVYQTPPLLRPLRIAGRPEVRLFASSSARDTDFVAKLIDVHPDGFAHQACYGIVRARYRKSLERPVLLRPGRVCEYAIRMLPTAILFREGHRIRVDLSSSDFPNFDRNHNPGGDDYGEAALKVARQQVFHDRDRPSRLILPVLAP